MEVALCGGLCVVLSLKCLGLAEQVCDVMSLGKKSAHYEQYSGRRGTPSLSFMPLGDQGPSESLTRCLELETDWENYEPEKAGHLFMAGNAVSITWRALGLSPHPGEQ